MSKPTEFRVWDAEFKFMRDDVSDFLVNSEGELYENCYPEAYKLPDKFIRTDYTGCKDKHYNKIFEEDIVKLKYVDKFISNTCPKCRGDGILPDHKSWSDYARIDCKECNKTGLIDFPEKEKTGKVYWAEGEAGFAIEWEDGQCQFSNILWDSLELIGNTFENQDLFKGEYNGRVDS